MSKPHVVVLIGGPDAEREISIESGTAVSIALKKNPAFHTTLELIEMPTVEELVALKADVIFPVLHGPYGEGGPLQQILEQTNIPFVGSGSIASAKAMDKIASKQIAQNIGIQTPNWEKITTPICDLQPPLVLKPTDDGSSVDIVICKSEQEVQVALPKLLQHRNIVLAESYKQGREITVSVVCGNPLPVIEIVPFTGNYDFAAKYERDDTRYILDPQLPDQTCVFGALEIVKEMNIRDLARVDFIIDDDGLWFLEVNTMPGFTDHSLLPMAALHTGLDMTMLCTKLIESATQDN
ncbi:MAG: D-alanine--D-alanine ligase [Planctomycetes bacterium]|nr:D-alanine--D-alanine ligase [Planctomycetota bacterium]